MPMEYTSSLGPIIRPEDIKKEIPNYYSKKDIDEVLKKLQGYVDEQLGVIVNDMISNGTISINLTNYYDKNDIKTIIQSLKTKTTCHQLTVDTDNQRVFTIPDIGYPIGTSLLFNTTVRTEYTISGTTLTTSFDVPLGSSLILVVNEIQSNLS